ncbi:MAG: ABC transporter permease [Archaeoglobaceae archaeon]|nr:ABC transporter permease [Archaeoglobaceae archaeon]MDW7989730.1 ABC transporter permease [Archaeoglobaceae archaeon]
MYLELAKRNIHRTKIRSILAIVGILIGVMAISAIGIFGESLKSAVLENFKDVANEIIVTPNYQKGYRYLEEREIESIKKISGIERAIAVKNEYLLIESRDLKTYATVYGLKEDDVKAMFKVERGSIDLDGNCVVGNSFARLLEVKTGSKIIINDREFKIAGILEDAGIRYDINPNLAVIISEKDFSTISTSGYSSIVVKTKEIEDVSRVKREIERRLNAKEEKVHVFEMKAILEMITEAFNQINLFLMAIASVSLLVAGVSILNIMLMSTIERTKEIGIMRAIGARKTTVLKLFLLEALILGLIGSLGGSVLSIVAGYGINYLILNETKFIFQFATIGYVFLGFIVGIGTSVISGLYPAWKASRLEPIEALRFE